MKYHATGVVDDETERLDWKSVAIGDRRRGCEGGGKMGREAEEPKFQNPTLGDSEGYLNSRALSQTKGKERSSIAASYILDVMSSMRTFQS